MSTTYPCDTCGSESATSDYCDMCGAALGARRPAPAADRDPTPPDPSPPVAGAAADDDARPAAGDTCYFCGAPRSADDVYCEVCGLDFVSGRVPSPPDPVAAPAPADPVPHPAPPDPVAAPAPVPTDEPFPAPARPTTVLPTGSRWTAAVGADRVFFDGNVTAGVVAFPDALVPRVLPLVGDEVTIGRRSESQGWHPDLDLSTPVDDPAVSRRHALLQRQADGSWAVMDVGSTNGTWINDEDDPLGHGVLRALDDGDRILMGAFTCITIRRDQA